MRRGPPFNFGARLAMLARLLQGPAETREIAAASGLGHEDAWRILAGWRHRGAVASSPPRPVRGLPLTWRINVPQTGVCGTPVFALDPASDFSRPEIQSRNLSPMRATGGSVNASRGQVG